MKNKVIIFVLSIVAVLGISIVAYAATDNVGGGVWDHGSTAGGVHSYYFHSQKKHHSAVGTSGGAEYKSPITKPTVKSRADIAKAWYETGYAYWSVDN